MSAKKLARIAVLTAALTGGKLALAGVPNVEIVTLLLVVYALTIGVKDSLIVCVVFILLEMAIWRTGMSAWIVLYFIYWPALVFLVGALPKGRFRIPAAIAVGMFLTPVFDALSAFIDAIVMGGLYARNFWVFFFIRYMNGWAPPIPFFLIHPVSNCIILPLLVPALYVPLSKLLRRVDMPRSDAKLKRGLTPIEPEEERAEIPESGKPSGAEPIIERPTESKEKRGAERVKL